MVWHERASFTTRLARASFAVPGWADKHARILSTAVEAFHHNKIELAILARACILASGDELVPKRGAIHKCECTPRCPIDDLLLESAERAILEKFYRY